MPTLYSEHRCTGTWPIYMNKSQHGTARFPRRRLLCQSQQRIKICKFTKPLKDHENRFLIRLKLRTVLAGDLAKEIQGVKMQRASDHRTGSFPDDIVCTG